MDISSLAILTLSLVCPVSLFVGAVGAIVALRSLGARWPWEQPATATAQPPARWRQKIVDRVAAEDAPDIVQREIDDGWRFVSGEQVTPGVMRLRFVKGGRW